MKTSRQGTPTTKSSVRKAKAGGKKRRSARTDLEMLEAAKAYFKQHGTLAVTNDNGLWAFVKRMTERANNGGDHWIDREFAALRKENDIKNPYGNLPPKWVQNFEHLKRYYAIHGHSNVRCNEEEGASNQLLNWVKTQRSQRVKEKLAPERIELLESLDFQWRLNEKRRPTQRDEAEQLEGRPTEGERDEEGAAASALEIAAPVEERNMGSNANDCMYSSEPEQEEDRAAEKEGQILHSGLDDSAMGHGQRQTGNSLVNGSWNTAAATKNPAQEDAGGDMMTPNAVPSVQLLPPIADASAETKADTFIYHGRASDAPTADPLDKIRYAYLQTITEAVWGDNNDVPYRHFEKCRDDPKLLWYILLKKGEHQQYPRALFALSFGGGGARTSQRSSGSNQALIKLLWTQNGYRRRGYAAILIDESLDHIEKESFVESGTRDTPQATALYRRYGFARVVGNCDDGAKFTITAENLRAEIKKQHMTFDLTQEHIAFDLTQE